MTENQSFAIEECSQRHQRGVHHLFWRIFILEIYAGSLQQSKYYFHKKHMKSAMHTSVLREWMENRVPFKLENQSNLWCICWQNPTFLTLPILSQWSLKVFAQIKVLPSTFTQSHLDLKLLLVLLFVGYNWPPAHSS